MTDLDCTWARSHIPEALRGSLGSQAEHRLREHLQGCERCREYERAERVLEEALSRLPAHRAPEALKARLRQVALRGTPTKQKPSHRVWLYAAAAAVVAIVIVALAWWQNYVESRRMVAEAVNDHLRVLYAEHPLEVESGGIHRVKPWFEGRLDFAPTLGFDGNDEFTLIGGSVGYFIDRKAAVFSFKHRLHVMSLVVFRAEGLPWPQVPNKTLGRLRAVSAQSRGFGTLLFRDGDLGYALVSDVEPATLQRLGTDIVNSLARP